MLLNGGSKVGDLEVSVSGGNTGHNGTSTHMSTVHDDGSVDQSRCLGGDATSDDSTPVVTNENTSWSAVDGDFFCEKMTILLPQKHYSLRDSIQQLVGAILG